MYLRIFYDSACPLCRMEMLHLKSFDDSNTIRLVDLHGEDLQTYYPFIDREIALQRLHGQLENGEMLYGLDVTCRAWTMVGKYRWLKVLRWPLIKPLADLFYRGFARYRHHFTALLTGQKETPVCTEQCQRDSSS